MASSPELTSAVVVGGSRGIGLACAKLLVTQRVAVLIVGRDADRAARAASESGSSAIVLDVSHPESIEPLARECSRYFGTPVPDALINAAGAFELAPLSETDPAMFERMIASNLNAPFNAIRAFLPEMLQRRRGHIVTIGSVAGRHAFPANGAYSASKFAVRGLHAVLDAELRGTGVRATLIEPAATDTPLWDGIEGSGLPPRSAMMQPEDVAEAVLFALTRPAHVDVRVMSLERA